MLLKRKLTLNKLFVVVFAIGALALSVMTLILVRYETSRLQHQWVSGVVLQSASRTSSYYNRLVTKIISDDERGLKDLFAQILQNEGLIDVKIVSPNEIDSSVFRTCSAHYSKAYFQEVPTCYDLGIREITVLHEIRSAGYSVGYLSKKMKRQQIGYRESPFFVQSIVILLCLLIFMALVSYFIRKYLMTPLQALVNSLDENYEATLKNSEFGLIEMDKLAQSLLQSLKSIRSYESKVKVYELEAKIGQMAQQVAHDIRSPLAALDMISSDILSLPEEKRLIVRSAVGRIKDIANELLQKNVNVGKEGVGSLNAAKPASSYLLSAVLDELITEKRALFRSKIGVEINYELGMAGYGVFVNVQASELKRVLSNLMNNAVESLNDSGAVVLSLASSDTEAKLSIKDNGGGIAPDLLPRLMQRGETHGKESGCGLGLYHAKTACETWGGRIAVESTVGVGTEVTISIPRVPAPHWFVPKLVLAPQGTVVVVDDDTSIHQIWQGRFEKLQVQARGIEVRHFSTPEEVEAWMGAEFDHARTTLFLVDYEFVGSSTNGIAVIEKLGIAKQSILVTSRYEEQAVRQECKRLGVKLIPKGMAGFVPVSIEAPKKKLDAVLIDDDPLVRSGWEMTAREKKLELLVFSTPDEFYAVIETIDLQTPIYIDSDLGNGVTGEDVSLHVSGKGFKKIFLATGYDADHFPAMAWISGIIGKRPPWDSGV